jgi:hypothetical protein
MVADDSMTALMATAVRHVKRQKTVEEVKKKSEYYDYHKRFQGIERPKTPDPFDHKTSKRTWEASMQSWRIALKEGLPDTRFVNYTQNKKTSNFVNYTLFVNLLPDSQQAFPNKHQILSTTPKHQSKRLSPLAPEFVPNYENMPKTLIWLECCQKPRMPDTLKWLGGVEDPKASCTDKRQCNICMHIQNHEM